MKVITIASQKGGSSKTTTSLLLASGLAKKMHKVLIIDMDPQANATMYLIPPIWQYNNSLAGMVGDYEAKLKDLPEFKEALQEEINKLKKKAKDADSLKEAVAEKYEELSKKFAAQYLESIKKYNTSFDVITGKAKITKAIYPSAGFGCHVMPGGQELTSLEQYALLNGGSNLIFKLREVLQTVSEYYDYVFIDVGPTIGFTATLALCATDYLIIPFRVGEDPLPQAQGIEVIYREAMNIRRSGNKNLRVLGLLKTCVTKRETDINSGGLMIASDLAAKLGAYEFENSFSNMSIVSAAHSQGKSIYNYIPRNSYGKTKLKEAQLQVEALLDEILKEGEK